jgi:hypothetical protein
MTDAVGDDGMDKAGLINALALEGELQLAAF